MQGLLILFSGLFCICCALDCPYPPPSSPSVVYLEEDAALMEIFVALGSPVYVLDGWGNPLLNHCCWLYVDCDEMQRVTSLQLGFNIGVRRLDGPLSPAVGNLTHLVTLKITNSGLSGCLPFTLPQIVNLQTLELTSNEFDCGLELDLRSMSNLTTFDIAGNLFQGYFPGNLMLPDSVATINIANCPFSAVNLSDLRKYSSLENFDCSKSSGARSQGFLENDIGNWWPKLKEFFIQNNHFTGNFPSSFEPSVKFRINNNWLEGGIPSNWTYSADLEINLSGNMFHGSLSFLCNLLTAQSIDLSMNLFSGEIPGCMVNMTTLNLSSNKLNGTVPQSLLDNAQLFNLHLNQNQLSGTIRVGGAHRLQKLFLSDNLFSGVLNLTVCKNLTVIVAARCNFSTVLIGDVEELVNFDLSHNSLESLPSFMSDANNLDRLAVDYNPLLSYEFEYGPHCSWNIPLFLKALSIRGCNISCTMSEFLSCFPWGKHSPGSVDARDNSIDCSYDYLVDDVIGSLDFRKQSGVAGSPWNVFPNDFSDARVGFVEENFVCNTLVGRSGFPILLDPSWIPLDAANCTCAPTFWGKPGQGCFACGVESQSTDGLKNCEGNRSYFGPGSFPSYNNFKFTGLDECKLVWKNKTQFTPCKGGALIFGARPAVDETVFCEDGYEKRLCSRCANGFYMAGDLCVSCAEVDQVVWPLALVGTAFGVALVVFLFVPQTALVFLWAEMVMFGVLLVVVGSGNWLVIALCVCMIVQIGLQIQNRLRKSRQQPDNRPLLSLASFLKLFIFFLQTNLSVNAEFWQSFDYLVQSLSFLNLDLAGAACSEKFAPVYENEWSVFLMKMIFPVALFLSVALLLLCRHAVQILVSKCSCVKKREEETLHHQVTLRESVANIGVFLAFVSYYELVEAIVSVFRWSKSRSGVKYLEELPWIMASTSDSEFSSLLICSACFLVLYVVGIPIMFAVLIFQKNRGHVGEFLWENYKPKYFFFELVWLLRRVSLAVVISAVSERSEFKPVLVVGLLGLYSVVQFFTRPFVNGPENVFDLIATIVITITYAESFWRAKGFEMSSIPSGYYFVLILNLLYVAALILVVAWPAIVSLKECFVKRRQREVIVFHELSSEETVTRERLAQAIANLNLEELSLEQMQDLLSTIEK